MGNKVDYKNGLNAIYRKDFRGKSVDLVTLTTPLFQDTHDTLQKFLYCFLYLYNYIY